MPTKYITGHAGYSQVYPGNTMLALRKAYEEGCNGIEFDVRTSSDGVLCLMHDETVDRTTDGTGYIHEMTWAEIQQLDAGSWYGAQFAGERVPSFEEVLDYFKDKPAFLFPEIEYHPSYWNIAAKAADMIHAKQMDHQVSIGCFTKEATVQALRRNPYIKGVMTSSSGSPDIASLITTAKASGISQLAVIYTSIDTTMVSAIHAAGLEISAWTPDATADIQSMIDLGVDGITSNYCDRLVSLAASNSLTLAVPEKTYYAHPVKVYRGGKFRTSKARVYENGMFREKAVKW